jgi:16S rRNA (adenine1518-N6/adenine1519-N6)-dimethyltransferase
MRADKSLGQHFLQDVEVLREITDVADVGRSSGVLEIGPGEGALTAFLVRAGRPVHAIERDPRAIAAVTERLGSLVQITEGDALEVDLGTLLPAPVEGLDLPVVVGNLPYNIGTAIYRNVLGLRGRISRAVLMLQREVAERIVAQPSTRAYSPLTALTALTARAWILRIVPPTAFRPRPKVDSAVLLVEGRPDARLALEEVEGFLGVAHSLFRLRRKTLVHAAIDAAALEAVGLDLGQRPEDVDPETLLALYRLLEEGSG